METPVKSAQGGCYQGGGTSLEMGAPPPPHTGNAVFPIA